MHAPAVTVATVTLNCAEAFRRTARSILSQDYVRLEFVVVDGGSTDRTLAVIGEYDGHIARWLTAKDDGPYFAMNKAVDLATGDYILFMNAGDRFFSAGAISSALAGAPPDADFILGDYLQVSDDGQWQLHEVGDFAVTAQRLREGRLDDDWWSGIPCHQATFTRVANLRSTRYDTAYRYAADQEFLYRCERDGARFHHADAVVAVYMSGGLSAQNYHRSMTELAWIGARYGDRDAAADYFGLMEHRLARREAARRYRSVPKWLQRSVKVPWWLMTMQFPAMLREYRASRCAAPADAAAAAVVRLFADGKIDLEDCKTRLRELRR